MRADNTSAIVRAAQQRHRTTLDRAAAALRRLDRGGVPVTFQAVSEAAQVSRAWLYRQPELRREIELLRAVSVASPPPTLPAAQLATPESLRRRLEVTRDEIRHLQEENERLREQAARLLGERRLNPPPNGR